MNRLINPPEQLFSRLQALLLILLLHAASACAGSCTIENRTYTPLRYLSWQGRGWSAEWETLLPGESVSYRASNRRQIKISLGEGSAQVFTLVAGDLYAVKRDGPRSAPKFVKAADGWWRSPEPPDSAGSTSQPFGPLEEFISECEQGGHAYRLSLRDFTDRCRTEQDANGNLPESLRFCEGFTWFIGYMVDEARGDVILLGTKDPTRPPIDVDCLATAIKSAYSGVTPGCSLDGHPNPDYQKSRVDGIPWNTRWAQVMIDADYEMKRVDQGHIDPQINGYLNDFAAMETVLMQYGKSGLGAPSNERGTYASRAWFNFDSSVPRSVADWSGTLVYLHTNPVRVSTEKEIDGRYGTGEIARDTKLTVESFTRHIQTFGKRFASIGELLTLYRLYDLMKHLREVSHSVPPDVRYWASEYVPPYPGPPATMPTLSRTQKIRARSGSGYERQTWTITGGVDMDVQCKEQSTLRAENTSGMSTSE